MNPGKFLKKISPKPYLIPEDFDFTGRWDTLLRIARAICPGFEIDDYNKEIYENGVKYFAGDPACKYDLSKGLYFFGPVGVGKTLFFKIFESINEAIKSQNNYRRISINKLIDGFSRNGYIYFSDSGITPSSYPYSRNHILLDDLGQSAGIIKHFGSEINVIAEFIQRRYYAYTDYFYLTHITSNIEPEEIQPQYGDFIASRMREMFNVILFPGKDRRK